MGQCRLTFTNTGSITLFPYNGNNLVIGTTTNSIPSGGVSVANTGLAASTLYYIYAFLVSTTITLEATTTTHITDPTTGIEVKLGDNSRTFIGLAFTDASSLFQYNGTKANVRSYYNRPSVFLAATLANAGSGTAVSFAEVSQTRLEAVVFGDDSVIQDLWATPVFTGAVSPAGAVFGLSAFNNGGASGISGSTQYPDQPNNFQNTVSIGGYTGPYNEGHNVFGLAYSLNAGQTGGTTFANSVIIR